MLIEGVVNVSLAIGKRSVRNEMHITPDLDELIIGSDWMAKQEKRIAYKFCVLMFDVKYGSAPAHLADQCNICTDERLRSTSRGDFVIPRTRTRTADSACMVAAPSVWNALPSELRTITSNTIVHNCFP